MIYDNFSPALESLKATMVADYEAWQSNYPRNKTERLNLRGRRTEIQAKMLDEYINGISFVEGHKYIKVVSGGGVWGFIVRGFDTKFQPGDILKAASWSAPARNKARGNILKGDLSSVSWTGPGASYGLGGYPL